MGKIVVGVDGSAGSRAALRWAFTEAKLRGTSLEAVIVWQYPITASLPTFGAMNTPDDFEVDARSTLLAFLADEGVSAEAPIPVSTLVAEGMLHAHFSTLPKTLISSSSGRVGTAASRECSLVQSANSA
jgi:nucleotide-binding universal stress UspA family protein